MSWPDLITPGGVLPAGRSLHRVPWPDGEELAGPISLADAKAYARITSAAEDVLAASMLAGAIEYGETATRRTIAQSLWDLVLDSFPSGELELRRSPVVEVVEIQHRNAADAWVVLDPAAYQVEIDGDRATVGPLIGASWPGVSGAPRSVRVRYRAGFRPHDADVYSPVPEPPLIGANLKTAVCELFTFRFDNRGLGSTNRLIEVAVPSAIDAAFWSERADL